MATNFVKKMAHSHFSQSGIQNGLQYHNFYFRILNRMNFSTLCTILVTFGAVTPDCEGNNCTLFDETAKIGISDQISQ